MDPNVIGRAKAGVADTGPRIGRIVVRGLTPATEGNASGIGFGDVALRRAVDAFDARRTYLNSITAKDVEGAKIPVTVDTDEDALGIALAACERVAGRDRADRPGPEHQAPRAPLDQRAGPAGCAGDR